MPIMLNSVTEARGHRESRELRSLSHSQTVALVSDAGLSPGSRLTLKMRTDCAPQYLTVVAPSSPREAWYRIAQSLTSVW